MNLQDLFNSMKFHESKEAKEKEQFKREQEQLREKIAQASPKSKMDMAWQLEDSVSSDSDRDESFPQDCICLICGDNFDDAAMAHLHIARTGHSNFELVCSSLDKYFAEVD